MHWIPINEAATKYDLHPLKLMSLIEKDVISGALIGSKWFVDDYTIQDFIREHHPISVSHKKLLHQSIKDLKKEINIEMQKNKQTLFILCSLDMCAPIFDCIIKEMAGIIDDPYTSEVFYSISTGSSFANVASRLKISVKEVTFLYHSASKLICERWKALATCRVELHKLSIQCKNYEVVIENLTGGEKEQALLTYRKQEEIPLEYSKILRTSLEKHGISTKTARTLRKHNLYFLEDLLRFIKKNGFDAIERLQGIGPTSSNQLLQRLIEIKIMEDKDNCYLFEYLVI